MSAPRTDPAPENAIIQANPPAPWWKTFCTTTGSSVSTGEPSSAVQNARNMKERIASWWRTNASPPRSSSRTDRVVATGVDTTCSDISEAMTTRNDRPFSAKHAADPSAASATPASRGPMMRARLNWMEFSAMALGISSRRTSIGRSDWYAGLPKACAVPVMHDSARISQMRTTSK